MGGFRYFQASLPWSPMHPFIDESMAYALLERAGLRAPRRGLLREPSDLEAMPFHPGESVVLKGVVRDAWHKSERGLVRFASFEPGLILEAATRMREGAGEDWMGLLVVQRVDYRRMDGLPCEALVALRRTPDAGWVVVMGLGGIHANAWGESVPPMLWPLAKADPGTALEELKAHLLGRIWMGTLRQGRALTTPAQMEAFLSGLWRLAGLLEAEGLGLLEMNPVVIDGSGDPVALDGVGEARAEEPPAPHRMRPAEDLHRLLVNPARIAVAGISSHEGSPGRVILQNLQRSTPGSVELIPIKPGQERVLGLPCLSGVEELREHPVDQLVLALPASRALRVIEQLCEQGGGAELVYLVSGGLGDGADASGKGARLESLLTQRRESGLWTPALAGPNGVGFLCAKGHLNSLFIPQEKLPFETAGGPLALVSQSGAFLLACLSKAPRLPLRYGVSIGNQLDIRLSDYLGALGCDGEIRVIACYVEGFRPGDLLETACIIEALDRRGIRVLLYKGGCSEAGQAAARSHTGALAGDWALQRNLLARAGALVADTPGAFEAAMAWLAAHQGGRPRRLAVLTNAGYEAVSSADHLGTLAMHRLSAPEAALLGQCLEEHGLQDLVSPHLPLDLTPMAGERAFLDAARLLSRTGADTLILGLVPFTQYLETGDGDAMLAFAKELKSIAEGSGKRLGVTVDAGPEFEAYRLALMGAGLPVFTTMERALGGLRVLAGA